jgi:hypothetical protein
MLGASSVRIYVPLNVVLQMVQSGVCDRLDGMALVEAIPDTALGVGNVGRGSILEDATAASLDFELVFL